RLPVIVTMDCLNAFFHHPDSPSLGEALVLSPAGGAIAFWGPSSVTSHLRQQELADQFYRSLQDPAIATLGAAVRAALRAAARDPAHRDVVKTWVLLGDPDLSLP
ncbi:MAG: C25 family cysteine peptidase, partial [Planctomycetota bacterium]